MNKTQIDIPILLPDIPDEKDSCVNRLIDMLQDKQGIQTVHLREGQPAEICIHYDPEVISLHQVKTIARQSGAGLTHCYRHGLFEVEGIRHQRHARTVGQSLQQIPGIVEASASAAGVLRLEWDSRQIDGATVERAIENTGLKIKRAEEENGHADDHEDEHDHIHKDDHEHNHDHAHGHEHAHGGFLGANTELYFAIGSGVFWLSGWLLYLTDASPYWLSKVLFGVALILGGYFTLLEAVETIRKGKFEIDFLMLVAAAGAVALGKWQEAALLLFLFSLGHALEHYAMNRARKSIAALSDLAPPTAFVRRNGETIEVGVEELVVGDIIVVKPNSKIAADGVVIAGSSAVNQAPITGESIPVDKRPLANAQEAHELDALPTENRAFAGTINSQQCIGNKSAETRKREYLIPADHIGQGSGDPKVAHTAAY